MICSQLPAFAILLLIVWAQRDHATSADVHLRAAEASRALFAQIRNSAPPAAGPVDFTLVNMPGYLLDRNIGAATFANGINELAVIASPRSNDHINACPSASARVAGRSNSRYARDQVRRASTTRSSRPLEQRHQRVPLAMAR